MPPMADPINSSIAVTAPDIALGSALCTECGMCCTGALHDFAVLDPDEIDYARSIGMRLRTEGRPGFDLPCPKLSGSCCSIYVDRPKACIQFKCALLGRLDDGLTDFQSATAIAVEARHLLDNVHAHLPDGMSVPMARAMNQAPPASNGDPIGRSSEMRLRLAIAALSLFLDRHFRKSSEGTLLSLEAIADVRPDTEMK